MGTKIRVEMEIEDGRYTLVLSERGKVLRRIPCGDETEARAAVSRLLNAAQSDPNCKKMVHTPEGAAWLRGTVH